MPLYSALFTDPFDAKLESCLVDDAKHITPGTTGEHVRKIQIALNRLATEATLTPPFRNGLIGMDGIYGPQTVAAVKNYKNTRSPPLLQSWQSTADDIVGKRTIESLDADMAVLELEILPLYGGYIAESHAGSPHEHSAICPAPSVDPEIELADDDTMSHFATPINPLGTGLMVNIGGKMETRYLHFRDYVPDPDLDPFFPRLMINGRPLTSSIKSNTVSDICYRSTPFDEYMKFEVRRLCMPGARFTFALTADVFSNDLRPYFASLGSIIAEGQIEEHLHDKADRTKLISLKRSFLVVRVQNVLTCKRVRWIKGERGPRFEN